MELRWLKTVLHKKCDENIDPEMQQTHKMCKNSNSSSSVSTNLSAGSGCGCSEYLTVKSGERTSRATECSSVVLSFDCLHFLLKC